MTTMKRLQQADFDFDEMARLAQHDPDSFERRRQEMLAEVIEQATPAIQQRLHGLQWQIDQVRNSAGNPMASCIRISKMMWDSVLEEDGLLENLERLQHGDLSGRKQDRHAATIIPLHDKSQTED